MNELIREEIKQIGACVNVECLYYDVNDKDGLNCTTRAIPWNCCDKYMPSKTSEQQEPNDKILCVRQKGESSFVVKMSYKSQYQIPDVMIIEEEWVNGEAIFARCLYDSDK